MVILEKVICAQTLHLHREGHVIVISIVVACRLSGIIDWSIPEIVRFRRAAWWKEGGLLYLLNFL
jgi:hypothetical protein